MFHSCRRRGVLILIGFVLFVGQFYIVLHKFNSPQQTLLVAEIPKSLQSVIEEDLVEESAEQDFNEEPAPILETERYQLMERYAQDRLAVIDPPFKRILFWNEAYGSKSFGVGHGREALRQFGCPVWQCETGENQTNVEEYDAVVFHLRSWKIDDVPLRRSPRQRYVFWSIESAAWRYTNTNQMAGFFNWTMTYRWDSDMVGPYGFIKPVGNAPLHPNEEQMKSYLSKLDPAVNYAQGKTKMAAWFVSNCFSHSKRDEMVQKLKKYVDVDIYGDCGTMKCPRTDEEECRKMAATKYKFYLSFENSLCLDYVTEKFFAMMHHPIIPIVVGFHRHHEKIAPTRSFINVADFSSIKELADYMILLDNNDTLYNEYFWWKNHFKVENNQDVFNQGMCHLCAALHDPTIPPKVYNDMTEWWDKNATCKTPVIR